MENKLDLKKVAAICIIITLVVAQFVEINIFSIGNIPISLQKITAMLVLPIGLLIIRHLEIKKELIILMILYVLTCCLRYWIMGEPGATVDILLLALGYFISALALYTVISDSPEMFFDFEKAWIVCAIISAVVTILQSMGIVHLFLVPDSALSSRVAFDSIYRGIGFKNDPNFQAMVLLIGFAFFRVYYNRNKIVVAIVNVLLIGGIVATMSRMGWLVCMIISLITPILNTATKPIKLMNIAKNAFVIVLIMLYVNYGAPTDFKQFVLQRGTDVTASLSTENQHNTDVTASLSTENQHNTDVTAALSKENQQNTAVTVSSSNENYHMSSADTRLLVARTALKLIPAYFLTGVGAFNTDKVIGEMSGYGGVAHNTYLEFSLMGGIWGIAFLILYFIITFKSIRGSTMMDSDLLTMQRSAVILAIVFMLCACLLSISFNFILWIPVTIALSYHRLLLNEDGYSKVTIDKP
jgi:hypothetical protein